MHLHIYKFVSAAGILIGLVLVACSSINEKSVETEEIAAIAENMQEPTLTSTVYPTHMSIPTAPSVPTATPEPTNTPEPVEKCIAAGLPEIACAGVSTNVDWIPYIQEFNGVEMALIPAGCFMMGSTEAEIDFAFGLCEESLGEGNCPHDWFEDEGPQHQVCFDEPFWIDVYEVTNEQYGEAAFGSDKWGNNCELRSKDDDQPRICIDWFDAVTHCESRGARLPTDAEWEYAARGPDGLIYPWGNDFAANHVVYYGNNFGGTSPVGSMLGGVSWVGIYDLSGNVSEWVSDWYDPEYYIGSSVDNPQGPESGMYRVLRGGAWDSRIAFLRGMDRIRNYPDTAIISFGFRCARSYEP